MEKNPNESKEEPQNEKDKKPELIIIQNKKCHFKSKGNSLQDNFKNFRSYINKVRKENKNQKKNKASIL